MLQSKSQSRERRKARIKASIKGKTPKAKLLVFRSNANNYAQLIDVSGKTLISCSDIKVDKGTKVEKAKNVGVEIAKKAQEHKITEVVFDRNGYKYHGRVKAIAEGAREGGLKF